METNHSSLIMEPSEVICNVSCSTSTRSSFFDMKLIQYSAEAATLGTILLFGVVFNSIVLILFYLRPSMRTFSNRFVFSLTLSHFLQAVLIMPSVFVSFVIEEWIFGNVWCQISGSLTILLNMTSVLSILLISIDRNCAVNNPLHYSTIITKKKTGLLITGAWVLSIIVSLPPIFGVSTIDFKPEWHTCTVLWDSTNFWNLVYGYILASVGFIVPLLNVVWIYISMFKAAKNNIIRARKNSVTSHFSDILVNIEHTKLGASQPFQLRKCISNTSQNTNSMCCFGGECKAAKTGIFVVFSFIICWLPFFLSVLSGPYFNIPNWLCFLVTIATFLSCIVNPYIYVFRNKTARKLIKRLLNCKDCLSRRHYLDSSRTFAQRALIKKHNHHTVNNICDANSTPTQSCVLHSVQVNTVLVSSHSDIFSLNYQDQKESSDLGESRTNLISHSVSNTKIYSINSTKPLLHQDSTSSSDSSDIGVCSILIDSPYNGNSDSSDWYEQFQQQRNSNVLKNNYQGKVNTVVANDVNFQEVIVSA